MPTITFKTITQLSFTLDLELQQTIGDVKAQIAKEKGDDYAVELQKLIYNGKILDDATTVEAAGIDTSKFVVVMLARKKVAEAPAAAPAAATTPAPAAVPVQSAPAAPAASADEAPLTAEQESMVKNIIEMGYPREQVIAVLRVSIWNPDRAVDLLMNGEIDLDSVLAQGGEAEDAEDTNFGGADGLDMLGNLPQLEELRNRVRQNPGVLPEMMQQIAQFNPELMNLISQNQEGFLRLLGGESRSARAGEGERGGAAGGPAEGQHVIQLTEQEAAAVQRIKSMGFRVDDGLIIEAYLACDKNEEMAIDYILNRMGEEDM